MNIAKKNHEYHKANEKNTRRTCISILMLLLLPVLVWSQQATNFEQTIKEKAYTATDDLWTFLPQMKIAAKALDACSKAKCNLTDPVNDKKAKVKDQINSILFGPYPPRSVQKNMAQFEKQLLKSKNFPKKLVVGSFKSNPGYSFDAMASRMRFYIMSMERIEDDE